MVDLKGPVRTLLVWTKGTEPQIAPGLHGVPVTLPPGTDHPRQDNGKIGRGRPDRRLRTVFPGAGGRERRKSYIRHPTTSPAGPRIPAPLPGAPCLRELRHSQNIGWTRRSLHSHRNYFSVQSYGASPAPEISPWLI